MSGEEEMVAKLSGILVDVRAIAKRLELYAPSVSIENYTGGALEVLLGGWDAKGKVWATKLIATLNPGQSCTTKALKHVHEFEPESGEYLLMRAKDSLVAFKIENYEEYGALLKKVTPQLFPWWQGTKVIKCYWLNAKSYTTSILNPNEQDVLYYFVVG